MNTEAKRGLLILVGGLLAYFLIKKIRPLKSKSKKKVSTAKQMDNARLVLAAYKSAVNDGQTSDFLTEMNLEFLKKFGLKVIPDRAAKKYIVVDKLGDKVL